MTRLHLATLSGLTTAGCLTLGLSLSGVAVSASSMTVKDDAFAPKTLTVSKGTKVTFKWKGSHPHNVRGTGASKFASKVQTSGSFKYTFKKKGTVKLVCDVHPGMKGTVKVK